jgi:hypothetical protein
MSQTFRLVRRPRRALGRGGMAFRVGQIKMILLSAESVLDYRKSILESNAEKVAVPPNQSAPANRSEIVKGQCELKRHELVVLTANACTGICDVADSASMYTRFLTEKKQRTFVDFRPADRSAFERVFPSIEAI